jgi:FkbM family methyltransferase
LSFVPVQSILRLFQRPEYFFRPVQVLRRLRRETILQRNGVKLSWGLPIELDPISHVGGDVLNLGVYDRVVPEAILRLLDGGETAIDVGANIGQNTSAMALAAGPAGMTIGFEPGPESWRLLTANVARWAAYDLSPITPVRKGASDRAGRALLHPVMDLGGFSLEEAPPGPLRRPREDGRAIDVEVTTLDEFLPGEAHVGFLKIDVEGHELKVLEGARRLIDEKRIRDIVYEDHLPQLSPVTRFLQAAGYTVFRVSETWRGPVLWDPREDPGALNLLATLDAERARVRFRKRGWKCLWASARLKAPRKSNG